MITPDYMMPQNHAKAETDSYVTSPPALFIRADDSQSIFALGPQEFTRFHEGVAGLYHYNVIRNGKDTGEWACRIERRGSKIFIYTPTGYKRWTGRTFV